MYSHKPVPREWYSRVGISGCKLKRMMVCGMQQWRMVSVDVRDEKDEDGRSDDGTCL